MNSGVTGERVYAGLKERMMTLAHRPGERLDPVPLAEALISSVTPVREALHRLTGEGLVESRAGGGFHVPALDEPLLRDRYRWSHYLLARAASSWTGTGLAPSPVGPDGTATAARTGALFATIARTCGNSEFGRAVETLNDRLHAVRIVEPEVLDGVPEELVSLEMVARESGGSELRRALSAYHRRRERVAAEIVRAAYRYPTLR